MKVPSTSVDTTPPSTGIVVDPTVEARPPASADLFQRVARGERVALPRPSTSTAIVHGASIGKALELPPLEASSFGPPMTLAELHALDPTVPFEEFMKIVHNSLESPDRLLRSFPGALWARVEALLSSGRVPGEIGFVLGDGHGSNFGYMHVGDRTIYTYTDLNSPGAGPVAIDALKTFYLLRAETGSKPLVHDAIRKYAEVVKHPDEAVGPPRSIAPDWRKIQAHHIANYTHGGKFRLGHATGLSALGANAAKDAEAIDHLFATDPRLSQYQILDKAQIVRDIGGDGGYERYWVLAKSERDGLRIIELKADPPPAADASGLDSHPDPKTRLDLVKQRLWGSTDSGDYFTALLNGVSFTVRDRMNMDAIDPTASGKKSERRTTFANVSVSAKAHGDAWGATKKKDVVRWIEGSLPGLDGWWRASVANIKKEYDAQKSRPS